MHLLHEMGGGTRKTDISVAVSLWGREPIRSGGAGFAETPGRATRPPGPGVDRPRTRDDTQRLRRTTDDPRPDFRRHGRPSRRPEDPGPANCGEGGRE